MTRILTIALRVFPRAADAAWRHKSASAVEMRETAGPIGVSSPIPTQSARLYSRWRRNRATGQLECSWLTEEPAGAGLTDVIDPLSLITGASALVFVTVRNTAHRARSSIP